MRPLEELLNLVPKYLNGLLTVEESSEFETGLRLHPILRRETEELRELRSGIGLADRYDNGHVAHELLIQSVYSPHSLSEEEMSSIASHTSSCQRCRENEELVKSSFLSITPKGPSIFASFSFQLKQWHERYSALARPILSPALAAVIILILAIPAFFGTYSFLQSGEGVREYSIERLGTRGGSDVETVEIAASDRLLRLEVLVPVQNAGVYDFELKSSSGATIYSLSGLAPVEPMSIEIPTTYLRAGDFLISFIERLPGTSEVSVITKLPIRIISSK